MSVRTLLRTIALAMLALAPALPAAAAGDSAGKVLVTRNQVDAERAGAVRRLTRRGDIFSGDAVRTGAQSRVGLRFVDGSVVSLDEESTLQIREFSHKTPGKPDSFVIELVSGGFRSLTGAISKVNEGAYQVKTPLASLSIRGTYFYSNINSDRDQLSVFVWQGAVQVFNDQGSVLIGPDYDFRGALVNEGEAPQGTDALDDLGGLGTELAEHDAENPQETTDQASAGSGGGGDPGNEGNGGFISPLLRSTETLLDQTPLGGVPIPGAPENGPPGGM